MNNFFYLWWEAAYTSLWFFWMALWAFSFGYLVSSLIQIFVTEKKMQETMGEWEGKWVLIWTLFWFISSSCSFAALATTKSLFQKWASFVSSMAYLLASTNLVIELGIIIGIFLGWQFIVWEYLWWIMLILITWWLIRIIRPKKLIKNARKNLWKNEHTQDSEENMSFTKKIRDEKNWAKVWKQYLMEWKMVWKDVTIGFTVAWMVSVFIPTSFFETLFIWVWNWNTDFSFFQILEHVVIGPFMAFITFIGSMGNIPLAAVLFNNWVSFAWVMAFIFSDLIVFPVLRINAKYYGWKMAFFISFLLFTSLVIASLLLHYGFNILGMLPDPSKVNIQDNEFFTLNYTFFLNILFLIASAYILWLALIKYSKMKYMKEMAEKWKTLENILKYFAYISYLWLGIWLILKVSGI